MAKSIHIPKAGKKGNPAFTKNGKGYAAAEKRTGETLSYEAKVRRKMFVAHYIKTTNATSAATFAGFKSPASKGAQLLHEPYVQNLLQDELDKLNLDAIMTQQEILFRFKEEANDTSSKNQSARVAALAHIAKIQGMMIERNETTLKGGGVMIVPAVQDADEWGSMAAEAQRKLKSDIKD